MNLSFLLCVVVGIKYELNTKHRHSNNDNNWEDEKNLRRGTHDIPPCYDLLVPYEFFSILATNSLGINKQNARHLTLVEPLGEEGLGGGRRRVFSSVLLPFLSATFASALFIHASPEATTQVTPSVRVSMMVQLPVFSDDHSSKTVALS